MKNKVTPEQEKAIISNHFSELAKRRHSKMSKKKSSEMGRMMIKARWDKYRKENGNKQTKPVSRGKGISKT